MKIALRYVLFALGASSALVGSTALYLHLSGVPRYKTETIDLHVTVIRYPMTRFPELTEEEVRALYAYLKTVPVIKNPRGQSVKYEFTQGVCSVARRAFAEIGREVIACAGCATAFTLRQVQGERVET